MPPTADAPRVHAYRVPATSVFPNNADLPLLVYPGALPATGSRPAAAFEACFRTNRWGNSWRNGIYDIHHYHSTAHEVLGVCGGSARVAFGGEGGLVLEVRAGDVVVIPAGVAHRNLEETRGFAVVGAYPEGQRWDMNTGRPGERPAADERIARVPLPAADPAFGVNGPLMALWRVKR
jgi:uncharacterized protein YjlB